jgi:hypothetical protein
MHRGPANAVAAKANANAIRSIVFPPDAPIVTGFDPDVSVSAAVAV